MNKLPMGKVYLSGSRISGKGIFAKQTASELRLVAKGTVTNQFGRNYSWVRLGEESALQLGDTVKAVYQDSLLHQLGEFTQQLGSGP